jgi:hypothetical protein
MRNIAAVRPENIVASDVSSYHAGSNRHHQRFISLSASIYVGASRYTRYRTQHPEIFFQVKPSKLNFMK